MHTYLPKAAHFARETPKLKRKPPKDAQFEEESPKIKVICQDLDRNVPTIGCCQIARQTQQKKRKWTKKRKVAYIFGIHFVKPNISAR